MTPALKQEVRPLPEPTPRPEAAPLAPAAAPTQQKRRWGRWLVGLLILAGGAVVVTPYGQNLVAPKPTEAPPLVVQRRVVSALGWLEPASKIIKLAAPATVEASRIGSLRVQEGDRVDAGQIVAVLDTADKLRAQVKTAEAQVALKRAMLARATADTENTANARNRAVDRAKADLAQAKADYDRQKSLAKQQFSTTATMEKRQRDRDVAQAQLDEALSASARLGQTIKGVDGQSQQIDLAVAQNELAAAEADLVYQRVQLDQASIRSPITGRVMAIHSQPGEKIAPEGVMELAATDKMVAIAEVYQSDIGVIRVGQMVELKSENFTAPIRGVVERVALSVKRQSVINNDPATDTDARVIEVRIALDAATSAQVAALSSLQVRANFQLEAP
jgi:HlyD family secretion protein